MATTIEECEELCKAVEETGLKYMMAETVVYAREYLFVKDLYDTGKLGKVQFIQSSHQQDMDGWPDYWPGLPPMHYATHCVGPCLALTNAQAEYVSCFGSGTIREELIPKYNSPFAVETATDRRRRPRASHGKKARAGDRRARQGARLRRSITRRDPDVYDEGRLRPRRRATPLLHPGRWPRRFTSAPGARVRVGLDRRSRPLPERRPVRELDLRRNLCARVGAQGWRDRPATGFYAGVARPWPDSPESS